MWPRSYFPGAYFAPTFFPQSEGEAVAVPAPPAGKVAAAAVYRPGAKAADVYS